MGKKDEPQPQPLTSIPSPPSLSTSINDYIQNYPKIFDLEKQYGPQLAQMDYDLFKQYSPLYTQELANQQKQLNPITYGLQEQLAQIASDGMSGGIPSALKNSYLDQLRAEIGPNAGSGIGADYVSTGLLRLGEDYKNYYQNLGLSLLNRVPISSPANPNFKSTNSLFDPTSAIQNNLGGYGSYVSGLVNQPYYMPSSRGGGGMGGGLGSALGMGVGALLAAPTGGVSIPVGAMLGGMMGGAGGSAFGGMF